MTRILIVGHPLSGYQGIERSLQACGMASARPSLRDRFLPQEISRTLAKAEALDATADDWRVQKPGPVWDGLALDLLLGNVEQPFWGWSDPDAIHWLEYWRNLDTSLQFILVYNHPYTMMSLAGRPQAPAGGEDAEMLISEWAFYNSALLGFFYRNSKRCLLVHADQVKSSRTVLRDIQARIDAPWVPDSEKTDTPTAIANAHAKPISQQSHVLGTLIAQALLSGRSDCQQLYEELQAAADLPGLDELDSASRVAKAAWEFLRAEQEQRASHEQATRQQEALLAKQREELEILHRELKSAREEAERTTVPDPQVGRENELLLEQIRQLQVQLERKHLQVAPDASQSTAAARPPAPAMVDATSQLIGAADRIRQQLRYRLGTTLIQNSHSLVGWMRMPWAVWRVVRQHQRDLPRRKGQKLPPIHSYQDASEADRVRKHLSFRLGDVVIRNHMSPIGWLRMPFALRHEIQLFRAQNRSGEEHGTNKA